MRKMANAQGADPQVWSDARQRLEHETSPGKVRVGDGQRSRLNLTTAPDRNVEIKNSGTPALAGPATKFSFHRLQSEKHLERLEIAFDEGNGVGEFPPGSPMGRINHDWRGIEQIELLVEPCDCGLDDMRWSAKSPMRPVRTNGDRVEM